MRDAKQLRHYDYKLRVSITDGDGGEQLQRRARRSTKKFRFSKLKSMNKKKRLNSLSILSPKHCL